MRRNKENRIVGALDTESSTFETPRGLRSVAVTFQIGWTGGDPVQTCDVDAVQVSVIRHQEQLGPILAPIILHGIKNNYTPVIAVHNLAYDLRYLMGYLELAYTGGYDIECCFKSSIKPLNVQIMKDDSPVLVFWDTLTFSGMSLEKMGRQTGREKAVGSWDYNLARHARTVLTPDELNYSKQDIYALLEWLKFWCSLTPEINTGELGTRILTKTSVVRSKCREIASRLQGRRKSGKKFTVYGDYLATCARELPASELEYSLMIRSTSAGWNFTASRGAGVAFSNVFKYDATSMHPSHMVSHYYPVSFEPLEDMEAAAFLFSTVCGKTVENVIAHWVRPFEYAFNGRFAFHNLRVRKGTLFERDGIVLHGSGLFSNYESRFADLDDESSNREFNFINEAGYANYAKDPVYLFGKLVSASVVIISLNELNAWVHSQVYEWDSFEVLAMSATASYKRPPDYVPVSVGEMVTRKQIVKKLMRGADIDKPAWMPESAYTSLKEDPDGQEAKDYYMLVKADLNSLYGMFATNEFRQSIDYIPEGNTFDYDGPRGFENAPEKPKAWYQFGMRIAAWSRVQQCIALMLLDDMGLVKCTINGDTDSFAFEGYSCVDHADVLETLEPLHEAINNAIGFCSVTPFTDSKPFDGLGLYTVDCVPDLYCAVANKRYAYLTDEGTKIHVASAGVPTSSIKRALEYELSQGERFDVATIKTLGYGVEYVGKLSGTKARTIPEWGEVLEEPLKVSDYTGATYVYPETTYVGLALVDTSKELGNNYPLDYQVCCANANIDMMPKRHYELVTNEAGEEVIGVW